ncbi:MAG: amidohydrolase family protein [Leucobacter sp.]
MDHQGSLIAARGIRVLDANGTFGSPTSVAWESGRFELGETGVQAGGAGTVTDGTVIDGSGLWMIPGLVDAHAHIAWHAFDAEDRECFTEEDQRLLTRAALARNLAAGFTSVRDGGGITPDEFAELVADQGASGSHEASTSPELAGASHSLSAMPRLQCSGAMLTRAAADEAGGLDRAVDRVLATGAPWVKLVATASVASPPGAGLEPVFTADEVADAVRRADAVGAGVMVHAWGGTAIDDAIDAGAFSIEHGIFLTDEQARRAAEHGMTLVPTLRIYRLVQRMIDERALPAAFRARVEEAVGAHPSAVLRARDAGLALAIGTDSGAPDQHGSGAREIDALNEAGLSPEEALLAATRGGAELLARVQVPPAADAPTGTIVSGAVADAVILNRDPRTPGALSDPTAIVAVILGGRAVDLDAVRAVGTLEISTQNSAIHHPATSADQAVRKDQQ